MGVFFFSFQIPDTRFQSLWATFVKRKRVTFVPASIVIASIFSGISLDFESVVDDRQMQKSSIQCVFSVKLFIKWLAKSNVQNIW